MASVVVLVPSFVMYSLAVQSAAPLGQEPDERVKFRARDSWGRNRPRPSGPGAALVAVEADERARGGRCGDVECHLLAPMGLTVRRIEQSEAKLEVGLVPPPPPPPWRLPAAAFSGEGCGSDCECGDCGDQGDANNVAANHRGESSLHHACDPTRLRLVQQ